MEDIYNVPRSKLINIKKFFDEYKKNLHVNNSDPLPKSDSDIAKILNSHTNGSDNNNDIKFEELLNSISIDTHLSQLDDVQTFDYEPGLTNYKYRAILEIPRRVLNLNTFSEVLQYKEKNYGSPFGMSALSYKLINNVKPNVNEENLLPYNDVLISIRFYRPYRFQSNSSGIYNKPRFSEEFLVLGTQYLTELRDKISCICNNKHLIDISDDPFQEIKNLEKNPGFFFITNTFYNDMRNPNNCDYSEVIREWSKKRKDFENKSIDNCAKMEETKFFDLNVHLGFPQVYQHHGNCEHLFTFSSIRLLSPEDNLKREMYPLLNSVAFPNAKLCNICAGREYMYVVMNSERQFHDPSYLCRLCFTSFYYIQGKKIGNFKAYKLNTNDEAIALESDNEDDIENLDDSDVDEDVDDNEDIISSDE